MLADDAFIQTITQYLSGDADLLSASPGGVWFDQADSEAPLPYTVWQWHHGVRELTFGHEAARTVYFRVKAFWSDAGGQNYATGAAIKERFYYLLDGVETVDARRIKAALNAYLIPLGWQCTLCREKNPIPLQGEALGDEKSNQRYSMGYVFEAQIQKV